ncbi:hypothetical protein M422DRAFT_37221 [Sphaerobolus stellatus SS14]|uniref:Flavoprotein domain-containing protein n=1 Tax=Sphaerobolus stellatus (strain SS14) TaxID=990650 RepID=A0A0C9UTX4_SPHS4|nr:hypothetical protein M422DRAFT_37221 [Sphaerobolus stellatus SS14]
MNSIGGAVTQAIRPVVALILTGCGPCDDASRFIEQALKKEWDIDVIATKQAMTIMDTNNVDKAIERRIPRPIRTTWALPSDPPHRAADAYIVAPASANVIAKSALCLADTYVSSLLLEVIARKIPLIMLPSLKAWVTGREPFIGYVDSLRKEGVTVLLGGEDGIHPTNDSSKDGPLPPFPWYLAIEATEKALKNPVISNA